MKVLLTSVCRPIGPDCGDGPAVGYELLHSQVTRAQGLFSPRALHLQFGLEYIASNLKTPAVVLHYPSESELIRELRKGYDYVGVSFVLSIFHKMKRVAELVRLHAPASKIVLGGYGTVVPDEMLAGLGDHVCREEGVGYFRRLLGEPETPMPYKHPLMVSRLKVFSWPVTNTGLIFGGLGCPNGCDFCCTSHFFKRKHIRLLPTGKDIFDVISRFHEVDPKMVFTVLDEDFLLNSTRAREFLQCVRESGKTLSLFCFASVKALSQYTMEEIVEMGVDGVWIGYEGRRSGYEKQQGRDVTELIPDLRNHGITVLTSMIIGLPYHDEATVRAEREELFSLKPALSQFLIYGPTPGTPYWDRVMQQDLFDPRFPPLSEQYLRRTDGFSAVVRHPNLSGADLERLQRESFDAEFQTLGPSIFRVIEAWVEGYDRLKDHVNERVRAKARMYLASLRDAYPVLWAGSLLGPNAQVRAWMRDLRERVVATLGHVPLSARFLSGAAAPLAVWTGLKLRLGIFQHPTTVRSEYRLPRRTKRSKVAAFLNWLIRPWAWSR